MAGSAIGGAMSGFTGSLVGMLASIPAVAVCEVRFRVLKSIPGVSWWRKTACSSRNAKIRMARSTPIADATSPHPDIGASAKVPMAAVRPASAKES